MDIQAAEVLDRAKLQLQDVGGVRWAEQELLLWLNDAQSQVVFYKPSATSTTISMPLKAGTHQTLPADAARLIRVVRNSGTDGVPGRSVRVVGRESLDATNPHWHNAEAARRFPECRHGGVVQHICYDEEAPRDFYVYPGIAKEFVGKASLDLVYAKVPTRINDRNDKLSLQHMWIPVLVDYILFKAYMKDAEYASNGERAGTHFQLFMAAVSSKGQLDLVKTVNSGNPAAKPEPMIPPGMLQ